MLCANIHYLTSMKLDLGFVHNSAPYCWMLYMLIIYLYHNPPYFWNLYACMNNLWTISPEKGWPMQSHPMHRMHFGFHQTSSDALGWLGDGDCLHACPQQSHCKSDQILRHLSNVAMKVVIQVSWCPIILAIFVSNKEWKLVWWECGYVLHMVYFVYYYAAQADFIALLLLITWKFLWVQ